ncbi:MAG TPA: FHA domain-containing protein [Candidatus Methylomirabilis sp.]|nr:FHA domain-containing protein [Candidatus Methylomirabilis sp.]
MPSPRFPAAATLLDAKVCPLDRFDALFTKITQERRIPDGYFLQAHPDEATLLFVVNASPYAAGRLAGQEFASLEIHEFFAAYARRPESPLSFFVADKRLLLGLMVLFRHRDVQQLTADVMAVEKVLGDLAMRMASAILSVGSGGEWAIGIVTKGRLAVNYFPPSPPPLEESNPADQFLAYVRTRPSDGLNVEVFEDTRVAPAGDVTLITPETRGHLGEVFLEAATKVQEEEAAPHMELAEIPEALMPELPQPAQTPEPEPVAPPFVAAEPEAPAEPAQPLSAEGEGTAITAFHEVPSVPPDAAPVSTSEPAPFSTPTTGPAPEIHLWLNDKLLGTFSLAKGELTIGRNPGNDILIENAGVSRRHAVIKWSDDRASIEDLGSANGTVINGKKIKIYELHDGDEIVIVKHRMIFRLPKEGEPPTAEAAIPTGQQTMYIDPTAVAQRMGGARSPRAESITPVLRPRLILPDLKKFALESEEVSLGSGADCQIQLSGMFVAKVHAKIIPQKEGHFKLVHVAGLAATRVNGEKITEHMLKHGDEIEIGKQKLLFRLER